MLAEVGEKEVDHNRRAILQTITSKVHEANNRCIQSYSNSRYCSPPPPTLRKIRLTRNEEDHEE